MPFTLSIQIQYESFIQQITKVRKLSACSDRRDLNLSLENHNRHIGHSHYAQKMDVGEKKKKGGGVTV